MIPTQHMKVKAVGEDTPETGMQSKAGKDIIRSMQYESTILCYSETAQSRDKWTRES